MKIPVPFWCYFLPMLAGTVGLIPQSHPLYTFLSQQLLPVCLVLLLIGTDLRAIARMGKPALLMMLAGAAGTVLGGLVSYRLYRPWLPPETWGGIGALTASWIGGSANMIAVKEALNVPDGIIGPLIIVDAAIAYSWMALLIWSSSQQEKWDRSVSRLPSRSGPPYARRPGVATRSLQGRSHLAARRNPASLLVGRRLSLVPRFARDSMPARSVKAGLSIPARGGYLSVILLAAVLLSLFAQWIAQRLPVAGAALGASTWTVLIVTTAALLLSLTPLKSLEQAGASKLGTLLLYALLASIGARADLRAIAHTPVFLALGATWILIHGACLLIAGRLARAPLGLMAAASQANIGGTVSAPIVGATFSPQLASVGLLMAIFGNLIGTYIGLATALMVRNIG